MIILSIISLILFIMCLWYFAYPFNPGFMSVYDELFLRKPFENSSNLTNIIKSGNAMDMLDGKVEYSFGDFWVYINRWMTFVMIAAILMLIVFSVLRLSGRIRGYALDISAYILVFLSLLGYYASVMILGKYMISLNWIHIKFFITAGFSLLMIVVCMVKHISQTAHGKRISERGETYAPKLVGKKLVGVILLITLIASAAVFLPNCRFIKTALDYSDNYAEYGKENHDRVTELEQEFLGNHQNDAVYTDKGLFFVGPYENADDGNSHSIRKLDSNGEVTTVYSFRDDKHSLGYCDGYIFMADQVGIYRLNPDTGEAETIITPEERYEITDFCVLDHRLYYIESQSLEDMIAEKDSDVKSDMIIPYIMCADISNDTVSEPYIYAEDISLKGVSYFDGYLLSRFLMHEPKAYDYGDRKQQYAGDYRVNLGEGSSSENKNTLRAFIPGQTFPTEIADVGSFNIHNGYAYYVQQTETGFDIVKCNPDCSSSEVIASYDAGRNCIGEACQHYNMAISDSKIVVVIDSRRLSEDGSMIDSTIYVTDLK